MNTIDNTKDVLTTIDRQTDNIMEATKRISTTSQMIAEETVYLQGIQILCDIMLQRSNFYNRIVISLGKAFESIGTVGIITHEKS